MAVTPDLRLLDALDDAAGRLVEALEADGCAISRALGDVLLLVTERVPPGETLQPEWGYLVSDYPETKHVLEHREPRAVCLGEPGLDPAEERALRQVGYASVLMFPLELKGEVWGLVEVYREAPVPFGPVEIRAAASVLSEFA
ncbi:MAG TPA: GAF domain-containing protein [Gaiellaceae bacterium]|nr:GAF domain-containing protein [Gaiellaceae bacterium]